MHRGAQAFRRHAVPHADLDQTTAASGVPGQTVTLGARRLRRRRRQTDRPGDVVRENLHSVSTAGTRWAARSVRARITVS